MLVYRVFAYDPTSATGEPGHPGYVHQPQRFGRWDNADAYDTWYVSKSPEGAIGETFGDLDMWLPSMFETPHLVNGRRALAIFSIPDDLSILDLDDSYTLVELGVRPTQIVARNAGFSQTLARRIFQTTTAAGARMWAGLSWWSYHHPSWTNIAIWVGPGEQSPLSLQQIEALNLRHPAVIDAARTLAKPLPRSSGRAGVSNS